MDFRKEDYPLPSYNCYKLLLPYLDPPGYLSPSLEYIPGRRMPKSMRKEEEYFLREELLEREYFFQQSEIYRAIQEVEYRGRYYGYTLEYSRQLEYLKGIQLSREIRIQEEKESLWQEIVVFYNKARRNWTIAKKQKDVENTQKSNAAVGLTRGPPHVELSPFSSFPQEIPAFSAAPWPKPSRGTPDTFGVGALRRADSESVVGIEVGVPSVQVSPFPSKTPRIFEAALQPCAQPSLEAPTTYKAPVTYEAPIAYEAPAAYEAAATQPHAQPYEAFEAPSAPSRPPPLPTQKEDPPILF
jgi:hypothetical protein